MKKKNWKNWHKYKYKHLMNGSQREVFSREFFSLFVFSFFHCWMLLFSFIFHFGYASLFYYYFFFLFRIDSMPTNSSLFSRGFFCWCLCVRFGSFAIFFSSHWCQFFALALRWLILLLLLWCLRAHNYNKQPYR